MNSTTIQKQLGLTFSALSLALLTACGGGGEADLPRPEAASAATVCGVQTTATTGPSAHQVSPSEAVEIDGFTTQLSLVTSPTGYPYDGDPVKLSIPLEDLRDVNHLGYTPQTTEDRMGIEMGSRLKAGSVGCVRGVSRVKNNGTDAEPSYELTWASETMANVSVDAVPDFAVNGFEFLNNFDTTDATAVFRMAKALVTDESAVRVCHITSSSIACSEPTISEDGTQWVFTAHLTQPGVYVLSAKERVLPSD